jgi:hypothetical protein
VETPPADKRPTLALQRALLTLLSWLRRVLGSAYQIVFRDQLGSINRQTERLGSAAVESVTHLGSEVRALDQRLDAIERELAALRKLIESREQSSTEDAEEVAAHPPGG